MVLEGPTVHIDHTVAAKEGDLQRQDYKMEEEGRRGVDLTDKAEVVNYQNEALVAYGEMKQEEEEVGSA